jgi:dUTPase
MNNPTIKFKKLHPLAQVPIRGPNNTVGIDVYAFCLSENDHPIKRVLAQRNTIVIRTMVAIELDPGYILVGGPPGYLLNRSVFMSSSINIMR